MTTYSDIEPTELRRVMGRFCTGLAVITGIADEGPVGLLVQSFVSVSIDPPLVLFCPQKSSLSWPKVAASGIFGANILHAEQRELCSAFSRSGGDKFRDVSWSPSRSGQPILGEHLAFVECEVLNIHDAGDHQIVVGRIAEMRESDVHDHPLLFYRGQLGRWSD